MKAGVYMIKRKGSDHCYVGSSKNIAARKRSHFWFLNSKQHHSTKLQRAWDKYGPDAFDFSVLLYCDEKNLLMYEQIFIDALSAQKLGYNICKKAGSRLGVPHDVDTVSKMRDFQRSHRQRYEWDGRMLCIAEIAEIVKIPRDTLWRRVAMDGWSMSEAVSTPYKKPGQELSGLGTQMTFLKWVERIGCTTSFLRLWLRKGLSIDDCVAKYKAITPCEFARVSGCSPGGFNGRLKRGWSVGDALAIPARKSFTHEEAKEIRELSKTLRDVDIARKFNVHKSTIGLIVNNKSFKEVAC